VSCLDLASRFTEMRRRGSQYSGKCPLPGHKDDTPSFFVTLDETRFWCHGCLVKKKAAATGPCTPPCWVRACPAAIGPPAPAHGPKSPAWS
jgi:hypothetical protein